MQGFASYFGSHSNIDKENVDATNGIINLLDVENRVEEIDPLTLFESDRTFF